MAKVVFRLGLDAGFFRVYYLQETEGDRRRLAGTVALFAALAASVLFAGVVLLRGPLTAGLLGADTPSHVLVVLAAADIFLGTFAFVPLSLLRIRDEPGRFSAFSLGRHTVNTVLKVVFVKQGLGVAGILWSDLLATAVFSLALSPVLLRHASLAFSTRLLRDALAFGLPKVPHGILVQALNLADRKILDLFVTRAEVGMYQMAYTVGGGVKFATSAFEPAWAPFVYAEVKRDGAPHTLARVATYAFAGFVATGLAVAVLGRELLVLLTPRNPAFWPGAIVIPWVALAYVLHGAFLLSSIGIGIERKARYYPIVTAASATVSVGLSFALIPHFGMIGAAWATVASYAVMAALGCFLSQRLYPLPVEWGRILRIVMAAMLVYAASLFAPRSLWPAVGVKLVVLAIFPGLLAALGFLRAQEREFLKSLRRR